MLIIQLCHLYFLLKILKCYIVYVNVNTNILVIHILIY